MKGNALNAVVVGIGVATVFVGVLTVVAWTRTARALAARAPDQPQVQELMEKWQLALEDLSAKRLKVIVEYDDGHREQLVERHLPESVAARRAVERALEDLASA
jgi:hypothetical protein